MPSLKSGKHATGALVVPDHVTESSAGGAEVFYHGAAGATERFPSRVRSSICWHLQECRRPWPMCRRMPIPVNCRRALSRSRLREALLITLAGLEALYLLATLFGLV